MAGHYIKLLVLGDQMLMHHFFRYSIIMVSLLAPTFHFEVQGMQLIKHKKLIRVLVNNFINRSEQNFLISTKFVSLYSKEYYHSSTLNDMDNKEFLNLQNKVQISSEKVRSFDLNHLEEFLLEMNTSEENVRKIIDIAKRRQDLSKQSTCTYNGFLIHKALENGDSILPLLRKSKDEGTLNIDIESRDSSFMTPLHKAAGSGVSSDVAILLEEGANPNSLTYALRSPLHCAIQQSDQKFTEGHVDTVKHLLNAGADQKLQDIAGNYPKGASVWDQKILLLTMLLSPGSAFFVGFVTMLILTG